MAQKDSEIAERFVKGEEIRRGLLRRTGGAGPWGGTQREGTVRFGVHGLSLRSYERWDVAVRLSTGLVVLNGDEGPSATTRAHQREVRSAVKRLGATHAFLPFSALTAAGIRVIWDIEVVATTADREITRKLPKPDKYGNTVTTDHFLGEVLFRHGGRLYVSGLDRNDEPRRRKFFLARLPEGAAAKTVDEALKALRPKGLPKDTLRQGEWFLVPSDKRPKAAEVVRSSERVREVWVAGKWFPPYRGVPVVTADAEVFRQALASSDVPWPATTLQRDASRELRERGRRHVASRVHLNGAVYVSGVMRDAEHGPMKLGDGRAWFKVVRNLADGSWGATGDVD